MNWLKVAQLTLVHVGVSITVVPITSTLNRIMIAEMGMSAAVVGLLVSLPYLLSPLQIIFGNWADTHPVLRRRRSPWIVAGGLAAAFGGYFTAHAVMLIDDAPALGLMAAGLTFLVWGVGVNVASVSYLSLITELSAEGSGGWRNRTVSVMWSGMILSTIGTALLLSRMLEPYSHEALHTAFGAVWMMASACILFGSSNLEPAMAVGSDLSHHAGENPLAALRVLSTNPSARRFFVYLLLILAGIHAQDVLLEPYGAQALGLSVAVTSRLTSIWGTAFLVTMVGGLPIVRRFGKRMAANSGALVAALAFLLLIVAGLIGQANVLTGAVFVLGLGSGLMTVSNLSFMLDMTIPEAAGLYMGAWGAANFVSQAAGSIVGGMLRDLFLYVTGSAVTGYMVVFGLEMIGLLLAIRVFRSISVEEFRRDARVGLADVLAIAQE